MALLFGRVSSVEDCNLGTAKRNPGTRSFDRGNVRASCRTGPAAIAVLREQRHALARPFRGDIESCHARDGGSVRGPAFPNIDRGCSFHHKVQAEHPEASRSKQPSRCPAPKNQLKPVTQRKGRQQ